MNAEVAQHSQDVGIVERIAAASFQALQFEVSPQHAFARSSSRPASALRFPMLSAGGSFRVFAISAFLADRAIALMEHGLR
jgi:hypothetical protein